MLLQERTAILFFTRNPDEEALQKRIVSKASQNHSLVSSLYLQTLETIRLTGIPYFLSDQLINSNDSFGNMIASASEKVFSSGIDNLIIVGNDCPQLTVQSILHVKEAFKNRNLIIGPDNRGGAYLIGISRKIFNKEIFAGLQWQTDLFCKQLISLTNYILVLPVLTDINKSADIRFVFHKLAGNLLCWQAMKDILVVQLFRNSDPSEVTPIIAPSAGLRAPPFAA